MGKTYFRALAIFFLIFGLITTFYPHLMQLFTSREGVNASTPFSDHVWMHDGLDIIAVSILLFTLSNLPATKTTLRAAAVVALLPAVSIIYGQFATPYWSPLILVPAAAALAFAVWGWALSGSRSTDTGVVGERPAGIG